MEIREAFTFDDVLLVPAASRVLPDRRHRDPRDQVDPDEHPAALFGDGHGDRGRMAIAMAQAGGIGVIHRNLDIEAQADEVRRVKRFESGIVYNPVTLTPDQTLADAKALMERYNVTGFPVVDEKGPGGRHRHQPRHALRQRRPHAGAGDDDRRQSRGAARAGRPRRGARA